MKPTQGFPRVLALFRRFDGPHEPVQNGTLGTVGGIRTEGFCGRWLCFGKLTSGGVFSPPGMI
jgi:hypothetical protein